jgi:hypothetical protein
MHVDVSELQVDTVRFTCVRSSGAIAAVSRKTAVPYPAEPATVSAPRCA